MFKGMEEEIEKNKPTVSERRMDELAWLLEGSSMCSAVSVINGRFYISANDFFNGTESRDKNQKLNDVCNIMEYFSDIANGNIFQKNRKERRDKLMAAICKNQISIASLGRITIPTNILNKIVSSDILWQKKLPDLTEEPNEKKYFEKYAGDAYRALSYGLDIYKRFLKIEQNIDDANKKDFSKITQEQLIAFKNFSHDDNFRINSNILFLQRDGGGMGNVSETKPKLVHAEAQILNQIVEMCEDGTIPPPNEIYIGISKRCCLNCHHLLDAANEELKKLNVSIKFEGSHDASFSSKWGSPPFFRQAEASGFGKTRKKTKEITEVSDEKKSLRERIRKKYLEKIKNAEEADSYNMGHSPSSSEHSLEASRKFENYKQQMLKDLESFTRRGFNDKLAKKMFDIGITLCNTTTFSDLFDPDYLEEVDKDVIISILEKEANIDKNSLLEFLANANYSPGFAIASFFGVSVQEKISEGTLNQFDSDYLLAWRLQVEEYRKRFGSLSSDISNKNTNTIYELKDPLSDNITQFNLRPATSGKNGRDCFFESVNKPSIIDRTKLINKLIENSTNTNVRNAFASEIRQFLYLGYTGLHADLKENKACQILLNDPEIRKLFLNLQEVEENLRVKVAEVRFQLGEPATKNKKPNELIQLLEGNNTILETELKKTYENIMNLDKSIIDYCSQEEVFKNYVNLYLDKAQGYIPFSRDFAWGNKSTTTVDIINVLFDLNIQVYLRQNSKSNQLIKVNENESDKEPIPIIHNGINHFDGLELEKFKIQEEFGQKNESKMQVDTEIKVDMLPMFNKMTSFEPLGQKTDDIRITLKKHLDGTYSIDESNEEFSLLKKKREHKK